MSWYATVPFVHIGAATALVGGSLLATPAIHAAILRTGTAAQARSRMSLGRPSATGRFAAAIADRGGAITAAIDQRGRSRRWTVGADAARR